MQHTIQRFFFTVAFSFLTIIAISQETSIYTTGFESAEGFTASTTYNNTTIKYDGPAGEQWGTYYGTASTTGPISGAMSMQMRFYTAAPTNFGYTFMNFDLPNVTKVTFKALNTSGNNVTASYSTDGGASYVGATLFTLSTGSTTHTYNISTTGEFANVRVRFMISVPASPVNGSRITIDDITVFGITGGNVPPAISNIIQTPADLITSSTTVSVSANVSDVDGTVASVQLRWGNTADALTNNINMPLASGSTYTTASNIPAQANKSTVYYSIYAEDNDGASTLSPVSSYEVFDPATTTLPYSEPLDLNLGDCYTFSVSGSTKFWIHNSTNGTAQMNGFNSGETEEDWFILPGFNINLEAYSLTFDSWWQYGIDDANNYLKLYYSTDYAGIGNPNNATWTELSYSQPTTSLTWTPSGLINLSGISGSPTWIGFKYRYEAGSYRYWQIDNLSIFDSSGPILSSNPVSLSGYTYTEGAGPSTSQTFTVSGQSLDGTNVSITAPVNFQVSLDNITYSNSITLTSYNGTNTTIYTRLNAGLTFNSYSGEITISGGGATSITVSLSGSVIPIPPSLKSFTSLGYQEDFATFGGLGFNSPPESFQLHSGNWKAIGMSDGIGTFDGIHTAGDFARGLSNGGVSSGGAFAFNVAAGTVALGAQPTAADFNPGAFVLKLQNTSTEPVGEILVSYDVYVYNDQEKSSLISFAYSYNDLNFTSVNELDYITDELPDATPAWEKVTRSAIISGLSFPVEGYIYLQWNCTDFAGGGSRDEFGITNIVLTPIEVAPGDPYISLSKPSLYNFGDVYLTNWSNVQFYDLLATNLISNLVITAPADFYVSLDCKTGFTSSLTIVPSGAGNILNTRIFVKYRPSVTGNTSGVVTHVSTGATTRNLAVSGKGINNQIPAGYYSTATGTGADLITQLHNIIKNHTTISYAAIWIRFGTTDVKYNSTVWDMYSDLQCTEPPYEFILYDDQDTGSGNEEGMVYNREHTWSSSWWGGSTTDTMYTDMNHIIPADRYVNIIRSNNPYGIVTNPSYTSQNGSKSGPNVYGTAFSGTTFEPIDEYKGDLARNHFYMVVRYNSRLAAWSGNANVSDIIDGSNYPAFKDWYINMLLEWHANDPVSQKEIDRNNAIYAIQGNRNPFIDNPNFVNQIWGGPIVPGSGDVNNDGFVNVLDVVWMVRYLNGDTPVGFNLVEADVTGDGLKNIADLTAMIALIMNGAK